MYGEQAQGRNIGVRFSFPNELSANLKPVEVIVNRFWPLLNYKRQLENGSRIDLYGKRMTFKYIHSNTQTFTIEYLQELVDKAKINLREGLQVQVYFEEMGG